MKGGKMNGIVFFQGSFDILNAGHIRAFKLAKQHGTYLIVGLNSDSLMRWYKREPIIPYKQRFEILSSIREINRIVECEQPQAVGYLQRFDADVYMLTKEWAKAQSEAIEWMKSREKKVVFSPRWKDIFDSSTIRDRVVRAK